MSLPHPQSNGKFLSQMSVRKFMDSLNLKIPAVKIYSFNSLIEQKNLRKPKSSLLKPASLPLKEPSSLATTESSYNQPKTAGSIKSNGKGGVFPELIPHNTKVIGKPMVIKGYKGFEGKIKKTPHVSQSKIFIKADNGSNNINLNEKIEKKRHLGIDNLKLESDVNGIEGFSQSTIRIEPDIDMEVWESQCELLDFIGYPSYRK